MDLQKTGKFIQEMRNKANMSQKELGQYLSVTDKAVSKWERGLSCPDVDNLKNMALLFNKTLSEIIYGTEKDARYSSNLPSDIKKEIM
ncbi:MAG: helix-turn-helix transcriptional regulator, partial [Clostridia bacterium]|nr:helix-turn-helix transcriptional regulator [Clostridia bacterium]